MDLGSDLRRRRRSLGWTQAELAGAAGLSVEGISLLERGRRVPRISTLVLLAEALGLDGSERAAWLRAADADGAAPASAPLWADDLVGRVAEVEALERFLSAGDRLVTVTGLGGMGKTRVAAAVARRLSGRYPSGIAWIRLAALRDPQAWSAGIAEALGAPSGGSIESLAAHLVGQEMLIVCDGAEHVLERCRHLVLALAARAPNLRFLVTSRTPLRVPSERVLPLGPLPLTDSSAPDTTVTTGTAEQLFLRLAHRPADLPLTRADLIAARRICSLVDGLPLAVELVAGRADVMSLPQLAADVAAGLTDPLAETVVGWSRQALSPAERDLLSRLAVFTTAFGHDDVQAVARCTPQEATTGLSALVASSLLGRAPDLDGQAMFRMLGVVRAVALRDLNDHDAGDAHRAHAEHLAGFVAAADPHLTGDNADATARALDARAEDVDSAMAWAAAHDPLLALRLAGSVWRWCYLRGRYAQGRAWAFEALAAAEALPHTEAVRPLRARVLGVGGGLAFLECDYDRARPAVAAARELYHELGETVAEAWALGRLGAIARERAAYGEAREWHHRSLALLGPDDAAPVDPLAFAEQRNALALVEWLAGDLPRAAAEAERAHRAASGLPEGEASVWACLNRGIVARLSGRLGEAEATLTRAGALSERHDFPEGIAWSLNQRGVVARLRGDHRRARQLQEAALAEHRRLGDRWREASTAEELALLSALAGDLERSGLLLAEATALREETGAPVPAAERDVVQQTIALLGG